MLLKWWLFLLWLVVSFVGYAYFTVPSGGDVFDVFVSRVVDGDTFEVSDGRRFRLLGVNTPERGFPYASGASSFLSSLVVNRSVEVEVFGVDRYGRFLVHVFVGGVHVNELLLEQGFATLYYYGRDRYYDDLLVAEAFARSSEIGLWSKSSFSSCVELLELSFVEETRCSHQEVVRLKNLCDRDLSFWLKDDATHIFEESVPANSVFVKNFSCVFNNAGDSLYVFDAEGLLLFERYSGV